MFNLMGSDVEILMGLFLGSDVVETLEYTSGAAWMAN